MADLSNKRNIIIAAVGLVTLVVIIATAVLIMRQPSQEDYTVANAEQLDALASTRKELSPSVNAYLASFKKAYNESKSADQASTAAKPEYDAYKKAESNATNAVATLHGNRAVNDNETGTAIRQLTDDYASEVAYFTSLVEQYPDYTVLFADKERCSGIFVGATSSLTDRKQKLDAAANNCYTALDQLKKSNNVTYVDYAKKIERRVKQLQADSDVTAEAEVNLKKYEDQLAAFQKKYADATARNASKEELLALADEIKVVTADVNENKVQFDFAAKRYISNVEGIPTLFQNVYGTDVPAKLKSFNELYNLRTTVLKLVLQDKLDA